ncbi:MAG: ribose 5-phosphate isomerase B [Humidesulfovibrio sp.]|uniref:ribose 5-phosphate isomerase B n=1 Tax=Humidesulfovibrio sp. TaxID=2910988 RepID=UPI0027F0B1C6|nr:ribose 5-phosphate isomerase B [Humidesulfovibrio sp.]MDQ7835672.1 ribose 5-phosphate isomerase B [Humidesulfovibrio sp.]
MSKTIVLASDHGGYALKSVLAQALRKVECVVEDLGPDCTSSCDYPAFADKLSKRLLDAGEEGQNGQVLGILICGTGLGMSMAANRHPGIRAAVCTNEFMARMARAHNNANVLCLGERVTGQGLALEIMRAFMEAPFEGGRHLRRIEQFETHSMA